jgi:hypothetical protein
LSFEEKKEGKAFEEHKCFAHTRKRKDRRKG